MMREKSVFNFHWIFARNWRVHAFHEFDFMNILVWFSVPRTYEQKKIIDAWKEKCVGSTWLKSASSAMYGAVGKMLQIKWQIVLLIGSKRAKRRVREKKEQNINPQRRNTQSRATKLCSVYPFRKTKKKKNKINVNKYRTLERQSQT